MKRTVYFAALAALVVSCDALAVGGIAQVTIIDRRNGVELTPYLYHGEYWVAGSPGASYAIEIRNQLDERILAVTSVEGQCHLRGHRGLESNRLRVRSGRQVSDHRVAQE